MYDFFAEPSQSINVEDFVDTYALFVFNVFARGDGDRNILKETNVVSSLWTNLLFTLFVVGKQRDE